MEHTKIHDAVKLIYFYQLKAPGFRSGDVIHNTKYSHIIEAATDESRQLMKNYRLQKITPESMSKLILRWLSERGII